MKELFISNWKEYLRKRDSNLCVDEELKIYREISNKVELYTILEWKNEAVNNDVFLNITDDEKEFATKIDEIYTKHANSKKDSFKATVEHFRFIDFPKRLLKLSIENNCYLTYKTKNRFLKAETHFEFSGKNKDILNIIKELALS